MTNTSIPHACGYAPVRGLRLYYEMHGAREGVPLVLFHGGGSTIDSTFGRLLPHLASHRVVAIEERGHGRSSDLDEPITFASSADDAAALLEYLKIGQADLFGFSNGASVALHVAIRHPVLVRKLIFASSITKRSGAPEQLWKFIDGGDFSVMPQALKDAFLAVNPDEAQLRSMHDKDATRMRTFADVPDEALRALRAATLILAGDRDITLPEHAIELSRLIPGGRLLLLPGGHGDYIGEASAQPAISGYPAITARLIERFLEEE
ncbi:MAG: alpha/beta hydrolase [Bryobacterales bacterium]|nr:alpha/beta hydrolase [Bryobacterales bacterium]